MNAIIRPKKGPGPFTVIAHAKGIIKNKSERRKWGGFPSRVAAEEWRAEVGREAFRTPDWRAET